ncbi:MAG: hypothetical protein R3F61_12780 [Myxococcota bacterium]
MWLVLSAPCLAAPPPEVRVELDGAALYGSTTLHVEVNGHDTEFDFTDQVHLDPEVHRDSAQLSLRLRAVSASTTLDRVASLWLVLAEEGAEHASLTSWIGILEPGRARLAGFPVEGVPSTLALSGDGDVVAWADAAFVHVVPIVAPPRPKLVYERDVDPPLFDVEPLLLDDLDLTDWSFGGPDVSLELFDMIDLVTPIVEDIDEPDDEPPTPRTEGAQRLGTDGVKLRAPPGGGGTVAALSQHGQELAIARGPRVAVWSVASQEARWEGSLEADVTDLRFPGSEDGSEVRATLSTGAVVWIGANGPVEKGAKL